MIKTDTDGSSVYLADLHQTSKLLACLFMILMEVAWIDSYFLDHLSSSDRYFRGEVNVCDKGSVDAFFSQAQLDLA